MLQSRNHLRTTAVTLVEVLIVIGILAVLFTLVMVGASAVRENALRAERAHWYSERLMGANPSRGLPISVLFVGNSLTINGDADVPQILLELSRDAKAKPELEIDTVVQGGRTLLQHWDDGVAQKKMSEKQFDFLVLQDQSQMPVFETEKMYRGCRLFGQDAKARQTIPLFYMTWSRPANPATQIQWTRPYVKITKELGAECAPCGLAWQRVLPLPIGPSLVASDGYHDTPIGAYLNACVFYACIYDRSPEGLTGQIDFAGRNVVNLSTADALTLQQQAWLSYKEVKPMIRPDWKP
jgi:hypothetical protein